MSRIMETYCDKNDTKESMIFSVAPTWDFFRDVIKEQYYPVGSYDDHYMRWTTLRQEWDHTVLEFTNIFHTLHTKMGIKYFKLHLVLKYRGCSHRYIQTKMEFLDISSLGTTYRYALKIEHKFKQKKPEFGFSNPSQQKKGKGDPNPQKKRLEQGWTPLGQTIQDTNKQG
jgi:hypothetical protein